MPSPRRIAAHALWVLVCLAIGFALTYDGPVVWDDAARVVHARWLLDHFGLADLSGATGANTRFYAPLWELALGIGHEIVFLWVQDTIWVRHALTLALYLWSLGALFVLLRKAQVRASTSALGVACVFGVIRLGGHAALNVKDAPAAVVFLLASVATWVLLRRAQGRPGAWGPLIGVGVVSALPFLVRVPLALHFVLVVAACGALAWTTRKVRTVLVPIAAALVVVVALYPPFWSLDPASWAGPFSRFGDFQFVGATRVLGFTFTSTDVPWYYALLWAPVVVHPFVFVLGLVGAIAPLRFRESDPALPLLGRPITLRRWLWLIVGLSWAAVLIKTPTLYDEERHILFLYPPLVLVAALGLDRLQATERVRFGLAAVVALASVYSYASWGRYAYVYKSPLIGDRSADLFLGDYWGACVSDAVAALPEHVEAGRPVKVDGPVLAAGLVQQRYKWSRVAANPDFGPYVWIDRPVAARPLAVITFNRPWTGDRPAAQSMLQQHAQSVEEGRARLVWTTAMPPGEPACGIFIYH